LGVLNQAGPEDGATNKSILTNSMLHADSVSCQQEKTEQNTKPERCVIIGLYALLLAFAAALGPS
jgi:hypothetical protein